MKETPNSSLYISRVSNQNGIAQLYIIVEIPFWARTHHKVVGNFGSEADVRSLYYQRFRFNETSDVGACTHGRPGK